MIYVFNTTIVPNQGLYQVERITKTEARKLLKRNKFKSAVGHNATAEFLSEVLKVEVPVNRIDPKLRVGDLALCFKLGKRPPNKKELSLKELKTSKYRFYLIERFGLGLGRGFAPFELRRELGGSESQMREILWSIENDNTVIFTGSTRSKRYVISSLASEANAIFNLRYPGSPTDTGIK